MTKLSVGDTAPDFSLNTRNNKQLTLQDLKGKFVVLYFYPKDNTPGCTIEAKGFNSLLPKFKELNAEVIGVSKDSLASHDKFCNKYSLEFTLGADEEGKVCTDYDVLVEKSMFGRKYTSINRVTFLIGPDSKIAHIWPDVSVFGHAKEVLDKRIELQ